MVKIVYEAEDLCLKNVEAEAKRKELLWNMLSKSGKILIFENIAKLHKAMMNDRYSFPCECVFCTRELANKLGEKDANKSKSKRRKRNKRKKMDNSPN